MRAVLPALFAVVALAGWDAFAISRGGPSLGSNVKTAEAAAFLTGPAAEVARRVAWGGVVLLVYLGIFTLPFSAVAASASHVPAADRGSARWPLWAGIAATLTVILGARGGPMPLVGNILLASGIGPATLRDTEILKLPHLPELPHAVRIAITAASVAGALLLTTLVARGVARSLRRDDGPASRPVVVLLTTVGAGWILAVVVAPYFDRYLLPLVPVALALAAEPLRAAGERGPATSSRAAAIAAIAIALGVAFSVAAVHDYLVWNRARWRAAGWLVDVRGASPATVDAGFEWNAWTRYDPGYVPRPGKSWWWVEDDQWLVAFGQIPGCREVGSVLYSRWLPPGGSGRIVVLERTTG